MVAQALRSHNPGGLVIVSTPLTDAMLRELRRFNPSTELGAIIKRCFRWLPPDLAHELMEYVCRSIVITTQLEIKVLRRPHSAYLLGRDLVEDHGIVSRKKVTTAGVTRLCVDWANAILDMKYMALGTGSGAEANTDTTLTEITNTHYTGSVRVTCTHAESSNTVPIVGTHTQATAGDTINEHGIFNSATVGNPTLWDRSLTGAQTLSVGDGLQGTYTLTASAEA